MLMFGIVDYKWLDFDKQISMLVVDLDELFG